LFGFIDSRTNAAEILPIKFSSEKQR